MRRFLAILLIIFGIFTICYPKLREGYCEYQQKKILKALVESWAKLNEYEDGQPLHTENFQTENATEVESKDEEDDYLNQFIQTHMEGLLKIDKISLELPILRGATKANLNISAANIEGTGMPGQVGNYCISAHRGRSYGRLFNRLDELEVGDIVKILEKDKEHTYEVFEKLMIEAEDTWVMLPQKDKKILTLITCDYSKKPYPRLVVRANLVENVYNQ